MSYIEVYPDINGVTKVGYRAAYVYEGKGYTYPIPAAVMVRFGTDARLSLDIADAEALMYALAVALVEHAVAVKVSPADPKAVA
ncbi:hypothetical protein IU433_17540 [Nocardia puris]|uniref:hypothetical protein n=1 Tax=Nocardia puris TaxID=208602 RepID=UPI00189377CD|nr:hypothetical protein [Nocardia puris]MBF6212248.1 hypothetical protein [Nocardia puris]MBF6370146.1 hypothetical protein [Nocardia puris]MBF6460837.1 hypothetical protein [Nocardia puris]